MTLPMYESSYIDIIAPNDIEKQKYYRIAMIPCWYQKM